MQDLRKQNPESAQRVEASEEEHVVDGFMFVDSEFGRDLQHVCCVCVQVCVQSVVFFLHQVEGEREGMEGKLLKEMRKTQARDGCD